MLGHASAALTLDIYADLFDDDLEAVAVALDTARADKCGQNVGKRVSGTGHGHAGGDAVLRPAGG